MFLSIFVAVVQIKSASDWYTSYEGDFGITGQYIRILYWVSNKIWINL